MGAVWNIVHPLSLIAIYAVIFGAIMGRDMAEVPGPFGFPIFLCTGFFPWIAFSDCINRGAYSILGNAQYLKKLPVPEQVFVAQSAVGATITLVISYAMFIIIALFLGLRPSVYWLLVPIPMIILQITGFGLGMIVGTLNVFFTDVSQILGIALQVLFWFTPIVYPTTRVPHLGFILRMSPATPPIEAIHDLLLWHRLPDPWIVWAMLGWAVGSLACGMWILNKLRGEIRDVL